MSRLPITFAGADYPDRTRPLIDGRVIPEGLDLNWQTVYVADLFRRMLVFNEFDACEMSLAYFVAIVSRGDDRFVGIPAFPHRDFRHGSIVVRAGAGVDKPEDLRGKRIGVPEYPMTAALWIRALLSHYGVKPTEIEWFQGGFDTPGFASRFPLDLPAEIHVTTIPQDQSLVAMLLAGDLEALIGPVKPKLFPHPKMRQLFPNYHQRDVEYYRRTGLFPIDHCLVVKREIYEQHRWIPNSLLVAFDKAREMGWRDFVNYATSGPMPWLDESIEELEELFHGTPYRYGFEPNRPVLEAATRYLLEQGIAKRKVEPEELFAPETLGSLVH